VSAPRPSFSLLCLTYWERHPAEGRAHDTTAARIFHHMRAEQWGEIALTHIRSLADIHAAAVEPCSAPGQAHFARTADAPDSLSPFWFRFFKDELDIKCGPGGDQD